MNGMENLRGKVDFQINFTVTKKNESEISNIFDLAEKVGAKALHFFFLVPTGRGREEDLITPERQEELLLQIDRERAQRGIDVQVTCAPQYARLAKPGIRVEARGAVWPARTSSSSPEGAMSIHAAIFLCESETSGNRILWRYGRIHRSFWRFERENSKESAAGAVSPEVCGGCRARAYARTGDYLESDPSCRLEA